MSELYHHGILGMKWGVRRYQNPDGTLTEAGIIRRAKSRIRSTEKSRKDVDAIVSSLSPKDRRMLVGNPDDIYLTREQGEFVVKRFLLKEGKTPVAFLDVLGSGSNLVKDDVSIAIAVSGEHQGKGYGYEVAKKGMDWIEKNRDMFNSIEWSAFKENDRSQNLAKKLGFEYSGEDEEFNIYKK